MERRLLKCFDIAADVKGNVGGSVSAERVERRMAVVLAGAVEDYGRLMRADEETVVTRLKLIRNTIVAPAIASHRGRIVKTSGDAILAEFASPVDAGRSAVEIQRAMAAQNPLTGWFLAACYARMGRLQQAREFAARHGIVRDGAWLAVNRLLGHAAHRDMALSGLMLATGEEPSD
jgi:hypothetical protein